MDTYCRTVTEQRSQVDLSVNSRRLVMSLDAIGFSEKTRETVTDYTVLHDVLYNINNVLSRFPHCRVTMGSRREGTTNIMLKSDHDVLHYSPLLRIYETVKLKTTCPFNTHLITLKDSHTPIGYTKIQLVQNGKIVRSKMDIVGNEKNVIYPFEKFKFDNNGRFVVSNEFSPHNDTVIHARNGPADTIDHEGRQPIDNVRAYLFDDVPEAISPWFSRSRPQGWPSKKTLKLCKRMGCFVVPVGHANSKERNLEWRFSMSFQEQHLMLNLNEAQYKCYVLLKLIKKFLIKPKFGDFLSSYHCKTCLFYTIEKVDAGSWTTLNLLKNLVKCLEQMVQWIKDGICPNFFVPDENMFASKQDKNSKGGISMYIESLIQSNCIDLVDITFEKFGYYLSTKCDLTDITTNTFLANEIAFEADAHSALYAICKFGVSYEHAYFLDLMQQNDGTCFNIVKSYMQGNTNLAEYFMTTLNTENLSKCAMASFGNVIGFINFCQEEIENNINGKTILRIELAMRYIFYSFSELEQSLHVPKGLNSFKIHYSHYREKQLVVKAIQLARTKVFTDIASSLAAEYVRTKNSKESLEILLTTLFYFNKGKALNYFSNRLKFARLLLIREMYDKCQSLLNKLVIIEMETIHTCICYDFNLPGRQRMDSKIFRLTQQRHLSSKGAEQCEETLASMRKQFIANNYTNCIIYDYYELDAINSPLFYEAFRSFGTPAHAKVFVDDYWFSRAVLDPVVYLHFLLIECNNQLAEKGGSAASLDMLENILFMSCSNSLRHPETAINLVGHVYVKKGWTKLAQECFRKSLNVRPLHNAAKWHIMFMLFGQ